MKAIYKNALINGIITDITVENGKITSLEKTSEDGFDLEGKKILPGLIDIHIHGVMNKDTMDGDKLNEISVFLAKNGVTSFLPTTMTVAMEDIKKVVNGDLPKCDGAEVLGYHLEGPYIAASKRGAQNIDYIRKPDIDEFNELENIKMVTVAPEAEGGLEFVKACKCVVSIGHTEADYDISLEAIRNGAKCLTHTFNAMAPLNHRMPGPIGAALAGDAYVQVICDGLHIHPAVIMLLYKAFGRERMIIISDAMKATGMADGVYEFGAQPVKVENSVARTLDGALAGSTSHILMGVKKVMEIGISEEDAVYMATEAPANLLGLNKGKLSVGYDADFIAVDEKFNVLMTVVGGNRVY